MRNRLMSRLLSLPMRTQMYLMALIVALPAAGIILFYGMKLRETAIAAAIQETRKISDGIANEQQHAASSAEQLMTALSQLPDIRNHDAAKTQKILAEILKISPLYLNISVAGPCGIVWASAVTTRPVSIADRRYFRNALTTGRLASGEYIVSRMASKPTLNLCYPYKNDSGVIEGFLSVAFNLEALGQSLSIARPGKYRYTLLDHRGIILARYSDAETYAGKLDLPEMIRNMQGPSDEGSFVGIGVDGERRFITFRKLRLKDEATPYLYVRAGIPVATVVAQANSLLLRNLLLFASSLVCALLVAWLLAKHSIMDRVALLQETSRRLAGGDLQARFSDDISGGELGELGRAFNEMAIQLETREGGRSRAERALRESENRYRSLFDNSLFGIVTIGTDNKFLRVNEAFCELLGYRESELAGVRNFAEVTHPDDVAESVEKHQSMIRGEFPRYTIEKRYITKSGSVVRVVCFVEGIYSKEGGFLGNIACILDTTELKQSQERMRLYFERQIVGMAITAPDKSWLQTNVRLRQMLGYTAPELSRQTWETLTHPDDLEKSLFLFNRMLSGAINEYVIGKRYLRKDGSWMDFFISICCVRKEDGSVDYVLALYDDITQRKRVEQEIETLQANLELRVQERTAELETAVSEQESFSYSVSHDLRSPLRHINSYLGILQEEFSGALPEEAHDYLRRARAASVKMGQLIDDLLELARVSRFKLVKETVDLSALAAGVIHVLRENDPARVADIRITPGLTAQGDKILVGLVLENLLGNAWKYSARRECTRLELGVQGAGREKAFFVRDNGTGFDMTYQDKLFGAFQRLHGEEYEGTGIGLATVKRIMERHGGSVWADAELDAGATFYFKFP
jgi:two-component system, cell cycle sensor histidine kinase and response regulator CckA